MKYFTIKELCASDTARRKGIENEPTSEIVRNLTALVDNILDPLREAWGKPIIVNSGYRCDALNKAVGGVPSSQHCFDSETELLTADGWKRYNVLSKGELIFSYSIERDKIELVPIDELIIQQYSGNAVRIKSTHMDLLVTDGHRMLVRNESHKYERKGNHKISERGRKYFDSLKTDNDKWHIELAKDVVGKRRVYKCASTLSATAIDDKGMLLLKLVVATVTDGCITYRNKRFSGIAFCLKRDRKIQHLLALLEALKLTHTIRIRKSDGATCIWLNSTSASEVFEIVGPDKVIPMWLIMLPSAQQRELIMEYTFYDGHKDERAGCDSGSIVTTNKQNLDVLQAMCALSGIRESVTVKPASTYNIKGKKGQSKEAYVLNLCYNRDSVKITEDKSTIEHYDGIMWCANNVNTTVIVRRNHAVSIQGNCKGQAADLDVGSRADNMKLFNLIEEMDLPFDQLCFEKGNTAVGPDWVHVSYSPRNRREIKYIR